MDMPGAMIVFAQVVDSRSFSAAAARLGLSKSAVSKQIAKLEDRLGARLLNRTTRTLSPTDAGQDFYERCLRVAREVEEAERAITHLSAEPRGVLRLNAPASFGREYLAPLVPEMLARWPELRIEALFEDRFVDVVAEGFDLVIRITRLQDSSLVARRIASCRRLVCAAPSYLARRGVPRTPAELLQHDCILYSYATDQNEWEFVGPDGRLETVRVDGRLRANNAEVTLAALRAGAGLALSPDFIVGPDIAAGRLVPLLTDYENPFGAIYAVWPHNRNLAPKVRAVVDFLVERFAAEPIWERR
ncbi:LysR family transcriptional regulator [Mycobacterium sp. KBS0706]|uniref:LysR family transcriptional regulator n=1 Tax=Mycobacterium sp. KBS0706 TaxID=2578109 RepID=UPI00110FDBF9|nr:LysR family transcriptional regulator [Mycobacterium sp. KBS0706]TSD83394.1 LysR family transcriptional regulator [Mycobacterium sp. KBS0706]